MSEVTASPSEAEVEGLFASMSNRGRWGEDDRLGTLNLITAEKRRQAATLVQEGLTVSCAWDIRPNAMSANASFGTPAQRYMVMTVGARWRPSGSGCCTTLYNGVPVSSQTPTSGATELSVVEAAGGIVSRGVLLDVPALTGRPWLEPAEPVRPADLDAACARQGVVVESGDVVLLHTGYARRRRELGMGMAISSEGYPGWHASTLPWLREHGVAAIGTDTATDVQPSGYTGVPTPVHYVGIVAMGLWLIDNCDFVELAQTCAQLGRWTFLFVLTGLRLRGGTGSPANPLAIL